jgi:hypothetical protein
MHNCSWLQVYMIDEPSSYLDVRQRLKAAKVRHKVCFSWQPCFGWQEIKHVANVNGWMHT